MGRTKRKIRGRFAVEKCDGWTLADYETGMCVSFETKREANTAARFARLYVRAWGGIDLGSFPYSLNDPWDGTVDGERSADGSRPLNSQGITHRWPGSLG